MNIYLHPHLAVIWAVTIVLKTIVAGVVSAKQWNHRSWFFTTYLVTSAIRSIALFAASALGLGWTYTWLYWIGANLLHGLAFGVAYEFFRRLFWPYTRLPRTFVRPLLLVIAFISIGAVLLSRTHEGARFYGLTLLDRSFVWWVCGLFWIASCASDRFKIPWRTREYGVAVGFLFTYSVDVFVATVRSTIPSHLFPSLWMVGFCSEFVTLAVWLYYFMRKEKELVPPTLGEIHDLEKILALFANTERGDRYREVIRG